MKQNEVHIFQKYFLNSRQKMAIYFVGFFLHLIFLSTKKNDYIQEQLWWEKNLQFNFSSQNLSIECKFFQNKVMIATFS